MKIKYCVKPQTVLTVQKENAFFAASISTSVTVHCVISLDCSGFPVFPSRLSKPNRSADGQTKETGQWQHLLLKVLLEVEKQWPCPERLCAGGGHRSLCWRLSGEPQREPRAHCPSWANAKREAAASQRRRPPWSTTSQRNESHFSTRGDHSHPPCANMGITETNYRSDGRKQEESAQGAFSTKYDSPGTSAPCSLQLQPGQGHLIPALFVSCNQDSCKAA